MHEIEPSGFCTIEEFLRSYEQRVTAEKISIGGLYLALADIRNGQGSPEAFKFPLRVKAINLEALADVTVDLLDADLQPDQEAQFSMNNGVAVRPNLIERSTGQKVKAMFFKDYEDFMPTDPSQATVMDEISVPELVLN